MDMFADTTLDDYYNEMTFKEAYSIVKYKKAKNMSLSSAKEELMDDFIKDWAENFGYETLD